MGTRGRHDSARSMFHPFASSGHGLDRIPFLLERSSTISASTSPSQLNTPFGGKLVNLIVSEARAAEMKATSKDYASITLDERALCDLELLSVGGFSPLTGFMGKADYDRVVSEMRLADGTLWPLPVTLSVKPGDGVEVGKTIALRDVYGNLLAFMHIEEIYAFDKAAEAQGAYGTTDAKHPAVAYLNRQPDHYAAGKPFYPPYGAQESMAKYKDEIGMEMVDFKLMVYLPDEQRYSPVDEVPKGVKTADISGTQVRDDYLAKGLQLPEWFSRPAVAEILNETNPPKFRQGLTIWFTGLSGSGKSTVAHALIERLAEYGRNVSLLDGDEIRTHLSKGLGFSKEDRDANINRVGYVAGLVAQHGGTTLCAVISPYRATRDNARKSSKGNFVEVYCDTPIEECEKRDVKGLYAKARAGEIKGFTGVDDPYEAPLSPEVTIDTSKLDVKASADTIIAKLLELGYILPHGHIGK